MKDAKPTILHDQQSQRHSRCRLRLRLALLAALVSVLVINLAGVALWQEKQRYRERASVATGNIARLLDQQISGVIDKIDLSLQTSSKIYTSMLAEGSLDAAHLNQHLAAQEALLPEIVSLRIVDAQGVVRYGRGVPAEGSVDVSDRSYFAEARNDPADRLIVHGPFLARISKAWVIVLARRLSKPDGSFAGVLYANLGCSYFESILSLASLGPNGAATIRTTDLALVHRFPDTRNAVGSKDVSAQLREVIAARPQGGEYLATTKLDGVERSNAYRRVERYPFYVIVGQATDDYLRAWRLSVLVISSLASLTLLVAWFATFRVYRSQIRLNEDIAQRTRIGEALERIIAERAQLYAELERRKDALEEANATLEQKVEERTLELSKANQALERFARRDTLTRLGNRLAADEHLHEEFLRMKRSGLAYSVLLIDIDHFKRVNDQFGHEQGDKVLRHVAHTLNHSCRVTDFLARFGGEEFLVILPATAPLQAALVAEKMRQTLAEARIEPVGQITVSIGVAAAWPSDEDENAAVRQADENLYRAKTEGRNRVAEDLRLPPGSS
ncbi:sensor domain-containing diguanylate cyclase [Uliginosibacterium sp. TH139]|uniref:sensor domain-containing diguanylate cyclase n=1 Tax=Uliginosibacterium sp. TH139 TaxID=2067453 RepID=UPI000C7C4054|nr:sensor domain-containing diguanylate cyclase [Uliginosibacterium sp. TH139]PLK49087.1 hypothetical protein C0V76_07750 [Uliginosibacterium sp. TH139]